MAASISLTLVGVLFLSVTVFSAPHQEDAREAKETSKRDAFANNQIGLKSSGLRDMMHKRAPRGPSVLWGRDVGAKDTLKNTEKGGELQPGMWGKRALVRPRLNLLWGRALKEKGPKMGLWGREKTKEIMGTPQAGLWGRSSDPGKIGLWGRQLGEEYKYPQRDGSIGGLWGKEVAGRSFENKARGEGGSNKELERELENRIIALFRQLKSTEQKREYLEERKPKDAIGIWGK